MRRAAGNVEVHLYAKRTSQVIVQDEASSVVWGMPGIVSKAGLADQIVPLKGLGAAIVDRVWRQRYSARAAV